MCVDPSPTEIMATDPAIPPSSSFHSLGRIHVCGAFADLLILDLLDSKTLSETDRILMELKKHSRLSLLENDRPDENGSTEPLIAVGEGGHRRDDPSSDRVLLFDSETKECVNQFVGVSGFGLETISNSSLSSNSIVISGGKRKILAFDSITSEVLCEFPKPPPSTFRISHFPEWNRNEVFVGGISPSPSRYDLYQDCVLLGSYVGHRTAVSGLSTSVSNHGVLLSGSRDRTLKMWDFNQFDSCVHSIALEKGCSSVKYLGELNLICCGTFSEIEIFDIRNLSQRIRKVENVGNGYVDELEDDSALCSHCVSGCGEFVSLWNPFTGAIVQKQECDGYVYGVQFQAGDMNSRRIHEEDLNERIGYLFSFLLMKEENRIVFGAMAELSFSFTERFPVMKWMILRF